MLSMLIGNSHEAHARGITIANDLRVRDRFWCFNRLWQHCGWYSAVQHVAAQCLSTGEKRIIAHVEPVTLFIEDFTGGAGI